MAPGLTCTWFLVSWSRSTQWSSGAPCISSIASTLEPESSSITSGTLKKSSPSNRDLKGKEKLVILNILVIQLTERLVIPVHTPEPLGRLCFPLVVALPGQLPLKNLQAAVCKQTWGEKHFKKNSNKYSTGTSETLRLSFKSKESLIENTISQNGSS